MFRKSCHSCFSGLKLPSHSAPPSLPSSPASSPPFSTCSDSSVLVKNFNSLYDPTAAASDCETLTLSFSLSLSLSRAGDACSSFSSSDDTWPSSPPSDRDLSTAIAARRLIPARPGRSKSIVEEENEEEEEGEEEWGPPPETEVVAVEKWSADPYGEFRRSMEEMVAAMGRERIHDLFLCYLALNRRRSHKYIVGAFADVLAAGAGDRSRGDFPPAEDD